MKSEKQRWESHGSRVWPPDVCLQPGGGCSCWLSARAEALDLLSGRNTRWFQLWTQDWENKQKRDFRAVFLCIHRPIIRLPGGAPNYARPVWHTALRASNELSVWIPAISAALTRSKHGETWARFRLETSRKLAEALGAAVLTQRFDSQTHDTTGVELHDAERVGIVTVQGRGLNPEPRVRQTLELTFKDISSLDPSVELYICDCWH